MVKLKKAFAVLIYFLLINSCNIDFLGFFYSNDLDDRLGERNTFHFISQDELTLSLGDEYSFIVLADTHIEDGNTFGFEKIKDVIDADSNIKFAVVLGDITQYGSEQDIVKFIEVAKSFGVPCYPVIGNHDVYFNNWSVWKEYIGSTSYRIDGDGTSLFILDSANSFFGKEQLDWLQTEIAGTEGRVFVFTHTSLFIDGPADIQQLTDTRERARIVSILRNKCDIMFMGHAHKHFENETGNVKYISIEDFRSKNKYCLVSVTNNDVNHEFITVQ